jgi:hypothetical protein
MQARPLFGSFAIGAVVTVPPPAPPAPPPAAAKPAPANAPATSLPANANHSPRLRVVPNTATPSTPATPAPAATPAAQALPPPPPPEKRVTPWLTDALRTLEPKLDLIHVAAFLGIALAAFLSCGSRAPLRLLVAMAFLSEIIPDWHDGWIDATDLLDLLANLAGIGLGAWLFHLVEFAARRLARRAATTA